MSSDWRARLERATKNEQTFQSYNARRADLEESGGTPGDEPVPLGRHRAIPRRRSCGGGHAVVAHIAPGSGPAIANAALDRTFPAAGVETRRCQISYV
jgi:hypothetical protein